MLPLNKKDLFSLCTLTFAAIVLGVHFRAWNFDDGAIVFRMVRNLVSSGEWGYNLGEAFNPSTSVLHPLLVALLSVVGFPIPTSAHIVGTLSLVALSCCTYLALRSILQSWSALLISAISLWVVGNTSSWGLETYLFLGILSWISLRSQSKHHPWIALGFLILARPDGLVVSGMYGLWYMYHYRKIPWIGFATTLAIISPWVGFSLLKFGEPFPATLSVKMWQGKSGLWGQGWIYAKGLGKYLETPPDAVVNLLALVAFFGMSPVFKAMPLLFLFTLFQQLTYCLINVPFYHWYVVALDLSRWILAAFCVIYPLEALVRRASWYKESFITATAGTITILLFGRYLFLTPPLDPRDEGYRIAAEKVHELRPHASSIAAVEVGTVGFHLPYRVLDLAGLASKNPELVSGQNTEYFFTHLPDVVLLHSPLWHFETAIADDARFDATFEEIGRTSHFAFPMVIYGKRNIVGGESISSFVSRNFPKAAHITLSGLPTADKNSSCIFDRVNGKPTKPGETLQSPALLLAASGWSAITDSDQLLGPIEIILIDPATSKSFSILQPHRLHRPDVGEHLKQPTQTNSGFAVKAGIIEIPSGTYGLWTRQKDPAGNDRWCGPVVQLRIIPQ
jgi:hypothetical protein